MMRTNGCSWPALAAVIVLTITSAASPLLSVLADTTGSPGSRALGYSTDFESNNDGWTHGGAKDEWDIGTPTDGPGYCHSGTKCWGTDLESTYDAEANEWLLSPTIDLQGANYAQLSYWQWHDFANLLGIMVDIGYLEISDDNGVNFKYLWDFNGTSANQAWEPVSVSLTDFLGKQVIIRFRLVSDELFEESGWFIDDVKVTTNGTGPGQSRHDLATTNVVLEPSAPNAGQSTQVNVHIGNVGDADEKGAKVTLTVQDAADMTTVFTDSQQIDIIAKGATIKVLFYWKPASSGTFLLTGKVNIDNDEVPGNDTYQIKVPVGNFPHNLAIVDMTSTPKEPKIGAQVTISVTVKNLGSEEEMRVKVQLRITSSTGTVVLEDSRPIQNIEPGAIRMVDFSWTPNIADLYIALANVPPKDDPTPEDNRAELYILVTKKGVDLAVTELIVRPKDGGPGMRRTIDTRVMNIGDQNATDVLVYYDVTGPNGPFIQGNMNQSISKISSGEVKQVLWDIYPDTPGIYTVHVHVKTANDNEPDNDQMTTTFSVRSAYRDVGIEALSVVPRVAELGISRAILTEAGNYGDISEAFRTTVRVMDGTGTQVMVKDFNLNLPPGGRVNVTMEYSPMAYGNYSVTATIYLGQDAQPQNDMMNTSFFVTKHQVHDLGIEVLEAEPRTGYSDVGRVITATISNNGDSSETGQVEFTIFDDSGNLRTNFTRLLSLDAGTVGEVNGTFVPGIAGTFWVNAAVKMVQNTDQEPTNDKMNISIISETRPPLIDLTIDAIATDPVPGVVGKELAVIVLVGNIGVSSTDGNLKLDIGDPNGLSTSKDSNFEIGPKGSVEIKFVMTPLISGNYSLSVKASVTGGGTDANMSNNIRSTKFQAIDLGTKDAAVISIVPDKSGVCGFTFEVRTKVQNKGTTDLTGVLVKLDIDSNGQTFNQTIMVDIPKGQTKDLKFDFTASKPGRYLFTARSTVSGDDIKTNDAMSAWGEACDPKSVDTGTRVETGLASWPWILLIIVVLVVCVVLYEHYKSRQEKKIMVPPPPVISSSTDDIYSRPAQPSRPSSLSLSRSRQGPSPAIQTRVRPPIKGPQRPPYSGQRRGR